MVREYCGTDEAVQHAYGVSPMEAFKPCQRWARNVLSAMEAPILVYLSGHCVLHPSIAASCRPRARTCCAVWAVTLKRPPRTGKPWRWSPTRPSGDFSSDS
jgi:hypothetical protein